MVRDRAASAYDATRREFFRSFSRQTVHNAGAVIGAAAELRRTSVAAARELLGPGANAAEPPRAVPEPAADFRSAYRYTGKAVVVLDQRQLPGTVATITCTDASEVAAAIRSGAAGGGPVLAEVAAYALALAAQADATRGADSSTFAFRTAVSMLRASRRETRAVAWAADRLSARYDALADSGTQADAVAVELRREADRVAAGAASAHAEIGRASAGLLPATDRPLNVLVHGSTGPLACGLVGMGTALAQSIVDRGQRIHVWLTEASPSGEGGRLAALELAQLDVPHTVIADAAVGWLLDNRHIDAVVLRADRVCANGDTGALLGAAGIARLASTAGVPVLVLAPLKSIDFESADRGAFPTAPRSAAETLAATRTAESLERPATYGVRLDPPVDVVPAALVSHHVTEAGALAPPYERTLNTALDAGP